MASKKKRKPAEATREPNASQERRIDWVHLSTLQAAKRNPKAHSSEIGTSVGRFGLVDPIVLDERTGRIVSGHGRREALLALREKGAEPPGGVRVDDAGEWTVPVMRGWASRDDAEAEAYLLAANRLVEVGGWSEDALGEMLRDLEGAGELAGIGFSGAEIDRLLDGADAVSPDALADVADAADSFEEAREIYVREGDLWRLGDHVVACGDSMTAAIDRLLAAAGASSVACVVTDPPYAIYGSSTGIGADIADDKMVRPFFEAFFKLCARVLDKFGHMYAFCDWRSWAAIWDSSRRAGITAKNKLIWDKGGAGLGSCYAMTYEEIFFGAKLPPPKSMSGNKETGQRVVHRPNVLRYNRPTGAERMHNAAKPVELLKELLINSTDEGALVLDPFCGSGSTLIACEGTKRRCATIDVEPKWVQTTIDRWQALTGRKAERIEVAPAEVAPSADEAS